MIWRVDNIYFWQEKLIWIATLGALWQLVVKRQRASVEASVLALLVRGHLEEERLLFALRELDSRQNCG